MIKSNIKFLVVLRGGVSMARVSILEFLKEAHITSRQLKLLFDDSINDFSKEEELQLLKILDNLEKDIMKFRSKIN